MGRVVLIAAVVALLAGQYAHAQQATPASTCDALKSQWRAVEVRLAEIDAEGIGDNSAPRATLRATENANQLATAEILLTLMAANKCPLPKRAPSKYNFGLDATKCATERLKGNYKAIECQSQNWLPAFKD